jgi:hypothetical protein
MGEPARYNHIFAVGEEVVKGEGFTLPKPEISALTSSPFFEHPFPDVVAGSYCSGGGWAEVPDLSNSTTREQVAQIVIDAYPGGSALTANYTGTGQLWALRNRIKPGDLLVIPMKTTKQITVGRVTGGYEYLSSEDDPNCRHVVRVKWQRTDVPRTTIKQDLLFTLGARYRSSPRARITRSLG